MALTRVAPARLAIAVVVAGCNPYHDTFPRPRCERAAHCMPGYRCERGFCTADRSVRIVTATRDGPVRAWLVAAPREAGEPLRSRRARLVATGVGTVAGARTRVIFEDVPDLPLWAVVWTGPEQPCGAGVSIVPVPLAHDAALTLAPGDSNNAGCIAAPRSLDYSDVAVFASARRRD